MLAEASTNAILQDMVDDAQVVAGSSASASYAGKGKGKGKSTFTVLDANEWEDYDSFMVDALYEPQLEQQEACPITDKDTKPFPIMDLPTEIRLEIYRACLTRPYNILLSKREQQIFSVKDDECAGSEDRLVTFEENSDEEGIHTARSRPPRNTVATQQNTQSSTRRTYTTDTARPASRSARRIRMPQSRSAPGSSGNISTSTSTTTAGAGSTRTRNAGYVFGASVPSRSGRQPGQARNKQAIALGPERPQSQDPLIVNIMLASKEIYKEARSVLYGENVFTLDLATAMPTLACLHQRSRRQIKHVELEIPTYNEILERFQETVRLSLRYCSGLKKFIVNMPFTLPGADGSGTTGNTTVYANGFDILRWLPQECHVILKGNICTEIETVVNKHLHLARTLDKVRRGAYQYSSHFLAREILKFEEQEKLQKEAEAAVIGGETSDKQ